MSALPRQGRPEADIEGAAGRAHVLVRERDGGARCNRGAENFSEAAKPLQYFFVRSAAINFVCLFVCLFLFVILFVRRPR